MCEFTVYVTSFNFDLSFLDMPELYEYTVSNVSRCAYFPASYQSFFVWFKEPAYYLFSLDDDKHMKRSLVLL